MARQTKAQKQAQIDAVESLRAMLPPGSVVSTVLTHVSKSGMQRRIKVLISHEGSVQNVSYLVAIALDWRLKEGAVVADGCGMDMGFHLVHCLSYALHGTKDVGPLASAASAKGRPFQPSPKNYRSGYSLRHEWT